MIFYHEVFAKLYKEQRWSHASLARRSGLSRQSISKWTTGQVTPSEKNIRTLAHVLKVAVSEISSYEDEVPISNLKINNAVDSVLAYSKRTTDEIYDDYAGLVDVATKQYKSMEQTAIVAKAILNSIPSISYVKDVKLKYITASESFVLNIGLRPDFSVLGKTDKDFFGKEEAEKNYLEDLEVIRTGTPVVDKEDYILGTRKKKWGLISKTPIFEEERIVGVLGVVNDISNRKRTEKQNAELRFTMDRLSEVVWIGHYTDVFHEKFKFTYTNNAVYNVFGLTEEEWYANKWRTVVHPDFQSKVNLSLKGKKYPKSIEFKIIHKPTGEEKWLQSITYKENNIFSGRVVDITKRKYLESFDSALIAVVNHVDSCIIISTNEPHMQYGEAFKILFANDGFEKLFDVPKEAILNNSTYIKTTLHPDDRKKVEKWWQTDCRPYISAFTSLEYRIVLPDGTVKWIEDAVTPAGSIDGKLIRFGILTDITSDKLQENTDK